MTVQVSAGQSLLDVCLQELGTLDTLFDLADANGLTITSPLRPGQLLQVPASVLSLPAVAAYFASRQQRINVPDRVLQPGAQPPVEPEVERLHDFDIKDLSKTDFY